jgi:hypothetical protein
MGISFVDYVSGLSDIDNNNQFIVKLPYCAGGVLRDKGSIKRHCKGKEGIKKAIMEFLRNHEFVLGYINYVIVQPQFPYSTEAKVSYLHPMSCFTGPGKFSNLWVY